MTDRLDDLKAVLAANALSGMVALDVLRDIGRHETVYQAITRLGLWPAIGTPEQWENYCKGGACPVGPNKSSLE